MQSQELRIEVLRQKRHIEILEDVVANLRAHLKGLGRSITAIADIEDGPEPDTGDAMGTPCEACEEPDTVFGSECVACHWTQRTAEAVGPPTQRLACPICSLGADACACPEEVAG